MIGSYADWGPDSEQYQWLERDLMAFNRSNTPWLVAAFHSPWYVLSCFAAEHHVSAALGKELRSIHTYPVCASPCLKFCMCTSTGMGYHMTSIGALRSPTKGTLRRISV